MRVAEVIARLLELEAIHGDLEVVIDTGSTLCAIEDIDLGASDEGVVIWCGDAVEG